MALVAGIPLVFLLALPFVALSFSSLDAGVWSSASSPTFVSALSLSLGTSVATVLVTVVSGTPLAWWLSRGEGWLRRAVEVLVELPIVIPPAVIGVALLSAFSSSSALGGFLAALDLRLPFSTAAVVMAQVVVSAPFFVHAAANAFRAIDDETLLVARTLGAGRFESVWRVAIPAALPGLVVGASLAWARALGEFGATLLFAGNKVGVTQTVPLAIFSALETDVDVAVALSVVLAAFGAGLLTILRSVPWLATRWRGRE